MTMEGSIGILSAIPGQFVGAAAYFGNLGAHNGDIWATLVNTLVRHACNLSIKINQRGFTK
jgi:hypothetical protein